MGRTAAASIIGGLLLAGCGLAGCGQGKPVATAKAPPPAGVAAATVQCSTLPGFVPLYADAAVSGCFQSASTVRANHDSGTVIYTTKAAPSVVLAWYRDQASVKGLADNMSGPTMYSARDGDKRTLMVMTAPKDGGSQVTINWGADKAG